MSDPALTAREKLQHRIAVALNGLPHRLQLLLTGGKPLVRDGLTLHPEMQLVLALRKILGAKSMSAFPPDVGRRVLRREALIHAGERVSVGGVRDFVLEAEGQGLMARHYAPRNRSRAAPLLVFFHGGGFVLGDLETHDGICRQLCHHADLHVLAVEYRKAPEAPFPAAVEDALAIYRWACANAETLGADASRIAVGGDSAGGNLAAIVSQIAPEAGLAAPAMQLLLYPAIDRREKRPSLERFAEGFFLTRADVEWFNAHYTGGARSGPVDPRLCPLACSDLSALPPALVVTAGFDPLRDEGEAYAEALRSAGTRTVLKRFDGLIHGFVNMTGVSRVCRDAVVEIATLTRELLAQERLERGEVA